MRRFAATQAATELRDGALPMLTTLLIAVPLAGALAVWVLPLSRESTSGLALLAILAELGLWLGSVRNFDFGSDLQQYSASREWFSELGISYAVGLYGFQYWLVGLTIVYIVYSLPFGLWMLQGYVASIPRDIEEAGAIDGAGRIRVLRSIVLPLLIPGIVATAMFTLISSWNEFFFALVLIQDPEKTTLPLTLARFVGAEGQVQLGALAAGALLATIPSLLFFAAVQRRLTAGLISGAVKG